MRHPDCVIRLLMIIPYGFPTFHPDIYALFGKYLVRYGVCTDLVAQGRLNTVKDVETLWEGGNVFLMSHIPGRIFKKLLSFIHTVRAIARVKNGAYDAIQVRDKVFSALAALWKARRARMRFFYWMSFPMVESSQYQARLYGHRLGLLRYWHAYFRGVLGAWLLYRVILPRSDHIFVQSKKMKEYVARHGIAMEKMTPVPMGVDMEEFNNVPASASKDPRLEGRRVLAYLGTCERSRRIDILFHVLRKVQEIETSTILLIIGDAREKEDRIWLRKESESAGVSDSVIWTGWLPRERALGYLFAADVAVSVVPTDPLLILGTPTKVIEYLALRKAVVANDHPDQIEVLNESGAGICVPLEINAFAAAICRLLQNPSEAEKMAGKGPSYIQSRRSYSKLAHDLADKYKRLIEKGRNGRVGYN